MTELAQLAAQQRCGFAKLMADVSHILSRETDQLDATFFVRKYEASLPAGPTVVSCCAATHRFPRSLL